MTAPKSPFTNLHESRPISQPALPNQPVQPNQIDWVGTAVKLALRNDLLSMKILEKLYLTPGHPFILDELVKTVLSPPDRKKKMTVWRRISYLKSLGLVETDQGKPMSVYPIRTIDSRNISHLLKLCYSKMVGDAYVRY